MLCNEIDKAVVTQLIGRAPRGLEAVAVRDNKGVPVVIRVAPLVENKPFPTLFWLVDKRLNYAIDQVEAGGLIAKFQKRVNESNTLHTQLIKDHQRHIALRESFFSITDKKAIKSLGFTSVFSDRGIGGIADFQRIRCLHTYYAAHLVSPNVVGHMLDEHWSQKEVSFGHLEVEACQT